MTKYIDDCFNDYLNPFIDLKLLKFIEKEGNFYKGNYKGFDYFIIRPHYYYRNHKEFLHLSGYIVIDKSSKYYISDSLDSYDFIETSRDINYCESDASHEDLPKKNSLSLGFGCMMEGDIWTALSLFSKRQENASYKDMYFVKRECKSIINQLIKHTDK